MRKGTFVLGLLLSLSLSGWAQERPQLVFQTGHSGSAEMLGVAELPDGYLGTAGSDGTVKVWNPGRKQVVRTVFDQSVSKEPTDAPRLNRAVFAPDGSWVVTCDNSGKFRRFSLPDGKLLGSFEVAGVSGGGALATDGQSLYMGSYKKLSKTDLFGKVLAAIELEDAPGDRGVLALSPDGALLALRRSGGVAVLDTANLQEKGFLKLNYPLQGLAFSANSQELALSSRSAFALLSVPDLQVKNLVEKTEQLGSHDLLPVWTSQGWMAVPYRSGSGEPMLRVDFQNKTFSPLGEAFTAACLDHLSDGRLLTGNWGGTSSIHSFDNGDSEELSADIGGFPAFAVVPGTGDLITGSRQGAVVRWSSDTGRNEQEYKGLEGFVSEVAVSPDGSKLLAGDLFYGNVCCWDIKSGKLLSKVEHLGRGHFGSGVSILRFVDNQRFFVATWEKKVLGLYNADTGALLDSWPTGGTIYSVALSGDAGRFVVGYHGGVMEASLSSKRDILATGLRRESATSVCYAGDGKRLYAGTDDGNVWSWDYSDPKNQPVQVFQDYSRPTIKLLKRSGTGLELLTDGGALELLDSGGKVKTKTKLDSDYVGSPVELPNDRTLAVGDNNTLVFLDNRSGDLLGRMTGVRNNEGWVVMEKSGDFDGNDSGLQTMTFQLGGRLFGVDQFLNQYFRPGVLARLLPKKETAAVNRSAPELTAANVKKPPMVEILEPHSGTILEDQTVTVKVKVTDEGNGIAAVGLIHNGHRLPQETAKKIDDNTYAFTLRPVKGKNEFRATAFDSSRSVEARQDRVRVLAPNVQARPPKLHLLSVGLDKYQSGLSLKFAEDDSNAVSKLFESNLYQPGERVLLLNEKATLQGIKAAVDEIAAKAEPQDAFVLYLAGHGTVVGDNYYFLPYDVKIDSDQALESSALSSQQLAEALREVPATKQLMVLDSCRSGAAVGVVSRYFASRSGLEEVRSQQLLARASGTFLIAATKGEEYAYEIPQLGHGVLTYAILESLGLAKNSDSSAPARAEQGMTANELLHQVSTRVPELSEKYQGVRQQVIQYSSGQDFPISK